MMDRSTPLTTTLTSTPGARVAVGAAAVIGFAALIGLAAHIRIHLPFTPVPVTLQTLMVLLAGGLLGSRLGLMSISLYGLAGVLGLPVLAGPALAGPTGGYIVGFAFAAVLMGVCVGQRSQVWTIAGAIAGSMIILLCGSLWLAVYTGGDMITALKLGMVPFLAGDALKTAAAVMLLRMGRPTFTRLLSGRI